jgi:hypothetical protein
MVCTLQTACTLQKACTLQRVFVHNSFSGRAWDDSDVFVCACAWTSFQSDQNLSSKVTRKTVYWQHHYFYWALSWFSFSALCSLNVAKLSPFFAVWDSDSSLSCVAGLEDSRSSKCDGLLSSSSCCSMIAISFKFPSSADPLVVSKLS